MASDKQNSTTRYRVRSIPRQSPKLRLRTESYRQENPNDLLAATIKVAHEKYVPPGVQVRAWVSPFIFTANVYQQSLAALEKDLEVVAIETTQSLRSS